MNGPQANSDAAAPLANKPASGHGTHQAPAPHSEGSASVSSKAPSSEAPSSEAPSTAHHAATAERSAARGADEPHAQGGTPARLDASPALSPSAGPDSQLAACAEPTTAKLPRDERAGEGPAATEPPADVPHPDADLPDPLRRRLLEIGAYTPPMILGEMIVPMLGQAPSCLPSACMPGQCMPAQCTPGSCAPSNCPPKTTPCQPPPPPCRPAPTPRLPNRRPGRGGHPCPNPLHAEQQTRHRY